MAEKYQNKYRISSARLPYWDYGNQGAYFVTICTYKKVHYFGEINKRVNYLSEMGQIVQSEWLKTPEIRPDMNLELGAFVVMPNHFHGVVVIGGNGGNGGCTGNGDAMHRVSTTNTNGVEYKNSFGPQSKNLASIIRGFKSSVTKQCRLFEPDFAWQSRYYDHIIRNERSLYIITRYIENNPLNWREDKFYW